MRFSQEHKEEISALFLILQKHSKQKFDADFESIDAIKNKSRKKSFVYFRKMMMMILSDIFMNKSSNYTQDEISEVVGLDRTSFVHHLKTHTNEYGRYKSYREEYDEIKDKFASALNLVKSESY